MLDFPPWKSWLSIIIIISSLVIVGYNFYNNNHSSSYSGGIKLGLDLQGGSYLVLEANEQNFKREYINSLAKYVKSILNDSQIDFSNFSQNDNSLSFQIDNPQQYNALHRKITSFNKSVAINKQQSLVTIQVTKSAYRTQLSLAIENSVEVLRRRIDQTGTNEPALRQSGYNKIIVELPGVDNPAEMKRILGTTARLTFHLVDSSATFSGTALKSGYKYLHSTDNVNYAVKIEPEIYGQNLVTAKLIFQQNAPVISFTFDRVGGVKFANITKKNVGHLLAVVIDNKIISAPKINSEISGGSGIITGSFSVQEAQELAILLQAGSLPVSLSVVEESTVGPTLGKAYIKSGIISALIGYALVFVYMIVFYRKLGIVANIALIINTLFIITALDLIGATLTLPGIAGIILTMGMAVDANILVYERFGQELKSFKGSFALLMSNSFNRVFITILDSNLTTLFTALFLFGFGSGPIRGFAVTLIIGLLSSMFSLMFVSRLLINCFVLNKNNRYKRLGQG